MKRGLTDVTENYEMIDGKLLQTDKKYAQLKLKQKREDCRTDVPGNQGLLYDKKYTFPNDKHLEEVW